ncbi:hypothetical protein I79_001502 [Cricetulus griseus]|uniref:Uncharacterized protein n=1 Tax=Cricetulus griseus TaxID=10029 RepID=G3GUX7_CRIGR|nr:hypothetical protein I79_001502 [Cricetulus griseus]
MTPKRQLEGRCTQELGQRAEWRCSTSVPRVRRDHHPDSDPTVRGAWRTRNQWT